MGIRTRFSIMALGVIASAFLVGCGSSGSTGATGGQSTPFKVGYVTDLSSVARSSYAPTLEGFQLYFNQLNANGGIGGHPVTVVVRDDGSSPDRAVSSATELATLNNVSAIFGLSLSSTDQAVFDAMKREKVPVVTGFSGIDSTLPPNPAPFGYTAGNVGSVIGTVGGDLLPKVIKSGRLVCTTINTPGGVNACALSEASATKLGYDIGPRVVFPIAAQDFTPIASKILSEHPDVVIGHYGSFWHQSMIAALRSEGYKGAYIATPWGTSEASLAAGAKTGGGQGDVFFYTRYAVVTENSPGMTNLRAAAKKFGTAFDLQNPHVYGWVLARIAHEALKACGYPCSSAGFKAALEKTKVDLEGLSGGPVQFSGNDHHGTSWWRLYKLKADGTLAPVTDWQKHAPTK